MDRELLKRIKEIRATQSTYETTEKWLGSDGKIYNIDRKPIDWDLIIKKEINR